MTKIDNLLNVKTFRKVNKMVNRTVFLVIMLLLIPLVSAAPSFTFKQHEPADLKISCFDLNKTLCQAGTSCFVTVQYPNMADLVKNQSLTFQEDYYNVTLQPLNETGIYSVVARCTGITSAFSTFTFEVTPTGKSQTSILDNPMLLILALLAIMLIGMGAYFHNPWFGFVGAIMFLLGGMYTLIYGFNNVTDFYTQGIGITLIGLGFVFMFTAAYEWIWGGEES